MTGTFSEQKKDFYQGPIGRVPRSVLKTLEDLSAHAQLRTLPGTLEGVDFHSNDYLGLARTPLDIPAFTSFLKHYGSDCGSHYGSSAGQLGRSIGATGSRLISGNRAALEDFEHFLATFHDTSAALVFNSGFEANVALIGCLGTRKAVFLYDEYVHASIREGLRVGFSKCYSFRHNDLENLQQLLVRYPGEEVYIVVESVYSMDGDCAPLAEIAAMCEAHNAFLIVDEAHSTGVYGNVGEGLVQSLHLSSAVFARVHTFGKAVGFRGACVVGDRALIDFIINKARPFIYSTAPDLFSIWWSRVLYNRMIESSRERSNLFSLSAYFHHQTQRSLAVSCSGSSSGEQLIEQANAFGLLRNASPIQGILCPGNQAVMSLESFLRGRGFGVKAIRSPTVPVGKERIRISLHSFNTEAEVDHLVEALLEAQSNGVLEN